MDSVFGFLGDGFVMLVADTTAARSIVATKHDEDKIHAIDTHKIAAAAGPSADVTSFVEYIQRNVALNEFRSGLQLSTLSTASFVKTELATALRKNPYQVNLLLGGFDKGLGASLFFIDYLGTLAKMDFAAHGYCGYFLLSLMDAHWKVGLGETEALALARLCIKELATRFTIHQPNFSVKIVDAKGVRVLQL